MTSSPLARVKIRIHQYLPLVMIGIYILVPEILPLIPHVPNLMKNQ